MIRWLQTSLFGRSSEEADVSPTTRPSSPPPKSPKPTNLIKPQSISDPDFAVRWKSLCGDADISLELVPRLRQGWKMSWRRGGGVATGVVLRAPQMFSEAPDDILRALAAWARLAMLRKSPARTKERRTLEKALHAWIEERHASDGHTLKLKRGRAARRLARLNPKGRHHDLSVILADIIATYFPDHAEVARARITWSARWGGLSTQSTARDEEGNPYPLISISRGYDHASATAEIVGGVVYHECLHIAVPPQEVTETSPNRGRRVVHGREFRRREKQYRFYDVWRAWHAQKLPGIIRRGDRRV